MIYSMYTAAPTMATMTKWPALWLALWTAALEAPAAVVPFGSVPLINAVLVPLTVATRTSELFMSAMDPLPSMLSTYVELVLSSQPQTEYCWQRQVIGRDSLLALCAEVL